MFLIFIVRYIAILFHFQVSSDISIWFIAFIDRDPNWFYNSLQYLCCSFGYAYFRILNFISIHLISLWFIRDELSILFYLTSTFLLPKYLLYSF